MRLIRHFAVVLSLASLGFASRPAAAEVKLPAVFSDGMVIQRDKPVVIWGWADPGEKVRVECSGGDKKDAFTTKGSKAGMVTANSEGEWKATLPPLPYRSTFTYQISVSGEKGGVLLDNILVGEVWVCSGQSNMQWSVSAANNPKQEIAAAKYPRIRLFYVPRLPDGTPANDVKAKWEICSPKTVGRFSAVAYFFGRHLHKELDVPVGLINTSWGGTRIEPWTPPAGFASVDKLKPIAKSIKKINESYKRLSKTAKSLGKKPPKHPLANRGRPTGLYNGMVAPLVPFAIRGAIWYQGEANRRDGLLYEQKMHALINGWRKVWGQGDFPFYYVQLAPYHYGNSDPSQLPLIWEAQTNVLKMKNTGMAVTVDVGKRLALWALAKDYGKKDLVYSGPLYKSKKIEGDKIRVSFEHVGGGLVSRDGKPLSWFEIAGKDGKFVKAEAKIEGETVLVWSDDVKNPRHVRFGWNKIAEPNLSNKDGLPASPFRTNRKK